MRKIQLVSIVIAIIGFCQAEMIEMPFEEKNDSEIQRESNLFSNSSDIQIVKLTNLDQLGYVGDIEIGNNRQKYRVIFDTGSNTLWLPSNSCVNSKICDNFKNGYTCSDSDGCTPTFKPKRIYYGKGFVKGFKSHTQLSICVMQSIEQQLMLVEKSKDFIQSKKIYFKSVKVDEILNLKFDGLFGLGVYDESNKNKNSFVTNLQNNKLIKEAVFSFYLGFKKDDSELIFGGFNPNKLQDASQIYYHPVVMYGYKTDFQRWALEVKQFSFSSMSYDFPAGGNTAVVDSGTSIIYVSPPAYKALVDIAVKKYDAIQLLGFLFVHCYQELPDLTFSLVDHQGIMRDYSIPKSFYMLEIDTLCVMLIQGKDMGDVQLLLGNVFMRRYVSIFSHTNSTVGLSLSITDPVHDYTKPSVSIVTIITKIILVLGIFWFFLQMMKKNKQNSNCQQFQSLQNNQTLFRGNGIRIG